MALAELAPDHPLLASRRELSDKGSAFSVITGSTVETLAAKVRAFIGTSETARRRLANTQYRYAQVVEVDKLVRKGMSREDARDMVGISRSGYDDWSSRLRNHLGETKGPRK